MKLGIVGLPNVGKSTLFNAITQAGAESANYPFCTIEPNVGVVAVLDGRLDVLAGIYHPKKVTPAVVEFVDIAGLVRGASKGEGLGNQFLSHIRQVDAIVHVVRCFEDDDIAHVDGAVDPIRDMKTIQVELIFADMEALERKIQRTGKAAKSGESQMKTELALYQRIYDALQKGVPVRAMSFTHEEQPLVDNLFLLTQKKMLYAANIAESDIGKSPESLSMVRTLMDRANEEGAGVLTISARIEEEIAQLDPEEKALFMEELGLTESGLDRLIKESYTLLGLISFLTAGEKEVRAWTIPRGTKAPQAAGVIHTDFEKGFIRAEIVPYDELVACGSFQAAKEKGLVRSEGKDYVVKDGDVVLFRFNV
jgi:GTP-binding protein YchF